VSGICCFLHSDGVKDWQYGSWGGFYPDPEGQVPWKIRNPAHETSLKCPKFGAETGVQSLLRTNTFNDLNHIVMAKSYIGDVFCGSATLFLALRIGV